jgi:tRNA threonylcarbamoyl adenosine modification protein YeaZ
VLVLTLDTSTPAVTAAVSELLDPGRLPERLASRTEVATNRHGELLAPMIDELLREAGVSTGDLGAVGVGLGPGPFTGLRVGIMTAAALGDALDLPVYGECSLDVIASPLDSDEFSYAVLTDARRKQVYWAAYDEVGGRTDGPDVATPADLAAQLAGRVSHVAGAGAIAYREHFADFTVIESGAYPDAAVLADLTPLYLRRPDAQPPGRPKQVTPA